MIDASKLIVGQIVYKNVKHTKPMTVIKVEAGFIAYVAYMAGSCSEIDYIYTDDKHSESWANWFFKKSDLFKYQSTQCKNTAISLARWAKEEIENERKKKK